MTPIESYTIINQKEEGSKLENFWKVVTLQKKKFFFTVELRMIHNVGYNRNAVLILDTYCKVVVLENTGKTVLVQSIIPKEEFKEPKAVLRIVTRKWGGETYEN